MRSMFAGYSRKGPGVATYLGRLASVTGAASFSILSRVFLRELADDASDALAPNLHVTNDKGGSISAP